MFNLKQTFTNARAILNGEPTVSCKIDGLKMWIQHETQHKHTIDGFSPHSTLKDLSFYYQIAVRSTGENPEYPKQDEANVCFFTNSDFMRNNSFPGNIVDATKVLSFELSEERYKHTKEPVVTLRTHYLDANAQKKEITLSFPLDYEPKPELPTFDKE